MNQSLYVSALCKSETFMKFQKICEQFYVKLQNLVFIFGFNFQGTNIFLVKSIGIFDDFSQSGASSRQR